MCLLLAAQICRGVALGTVDAVLLRNGANLNLVEDRQVIGRDFVIQIRKS
jgi:hypothetical protein